MRKHLTLGQGQSFSYCATECNQCGAALSDNARNELCRKCVAQFTRGQNSIVERIIRAQGSIKANV